MGIVSSIKRRIYKRLVKFDQGIQYYLNHILPTNLTMRYVLGLGLIAFLAGAGQILIQISLDKQLATQRSIRTLDRQLPLVEELRKTTFVFQLSSKKEEISAQMITIQAMLDRLKQSHADMVKSELFAVLKAVDGSSAFETSLLRLEESLSELVQYYSDQSKYSYDSLTRNLNPMAQDLIEAITVYQTMTKHSIRHFEGLVDSQVSRFKKTELILFIASLLVLLLEALYVFRPAVARLYGALRIRSDFLSKMSHELRNPMNSIIGMSHLLSESATTQQQKNYLSVLKRSSAGLLEMLNGLLDFSSLELGKFKLESIQFNLYEVLERCLDLVVMSAQPNKTELILDISDDVPLCVVGDPVRIQQIIFNLLGNAVKFTRQGNVTLRVENVSRRDRLMIRFSVTDTGIGIEPERLNLIFEPFVQENITIKRKFGGSGLGLSIVKELVERMSGKLEVSSEKNLGSRFSFTIPLENSDTQNLGEVLSQFQLPHFKAHLLIRDHAVMNSIKTLLKSLNATVVRVTQAQELLDLDVTEQGVQNVLLAEHEEFIKIFPAGSRQPDFIKKGKALFIFNSSSRPQEAEKLEAESALVLLFKPIRPLALAEMLKQVLLGKNMEKEQKALDPTEHKPLRILIADDSHDNQLLIQAYLQNTPYTLTFVADGLAAVDQYKSHDFDLIVMDIEMPRLDGREATKQIRQYEIEKQKKRVPVLALSAYDHPESKELPSGFSAYLTKPVLSNALIDKIKALTNPAPAPVSATKRISDAVANLNNRIARLVPAYLENRQKELHELKGFLLGHDYHAIERVGHKLKGNAASYGFAQLGHLGAELEIQAKKSDHEKVSHLIQEIEGFLREAKTPQPSPEKFH